MAAGSLTIKLRPLRLAFVIESTDRHSLLTAIEAASCMWGGQFNPILPRFRKLPEVWRRSVSRNIKAQTLFDGYVNAFDPDFFVAVGALESAKLSFPQESVIKCSSITDPVAKDATPGIGIGLIEVLQHFADEEFRFVRRDPIKIVMPKFDNTHRLFLASVFGLLPDVFGRLFSVTCDHIPEVEWRECSIDNYWQFLAPDNLFIRRLGSLYLQPRRLWHHRGSCIFILDPEEPIDIIDYWNLRAVGWNIIPIAKQVLATDALLQFAADFIEENAFAPRTNPDLYYHTTILASRTTTVSEAEEFGKRVRPLLTAPSHPHNWKATYQFWAPRIWDESAHETDGVDPCEIEVREEKHEFIDADKHTSFSSLIPEWASRFGGHGRPRCANEVDLRIWGGSFFPAEVIPQGDRRIASAAGASDFHNWRCGKKGLVYLPEHSGWRERINLVPGEQVFAAWLQTRGWKSVLSDKGHIAKQMLKNLGGAFGIRLLTTPGVVELLGKLSEGRTMHESAFRGAIAEIVNRQKNPLSHAGRIASQLLDSRMIQPGLEMQCPHCRQHSWYSLNEVDYALRCPKCLENFNVPADDLRSISWAYRAIGPFSLPRQAYGVYSVLLTVHFFTRQFNRPTTPMLSFTATKGTSAIEADLGLFFRESRYRQSRTDVVFAECKTFNEFRRADADRMLLLADEFPGAVLVFSTLRTSLTDPEKRLLRRVANHGRRPWKADQPYNPVLILTGNELLTTSDPKTVWAKLGGLHALRAQASASRPELLQLADDTQQIYLGMQGWHQWRNERMRRGRKPAADAKPPQQQSKMIRLSFPLSLKMVKS